MSRERSHGNEPGIHLGAGKTKSVVSALVLRSPSEPPGRSPVHDVRSAAGGGRIAAGSFAVLHPIRTSPAHDRGVRQGTSADRRQLDQDWLSAARLVRRAGFGATGTQVDAVVSSGRAAFVAALGSDQSADKGLAPLPAPTFPQVPPLGKTAHTAARKARRSRITDQLRQLSGWWLRRMVQVDQPVVEKLTFLWHNHFATAASKVRDATLMLGQNQ